MIFVPPDVYVLLPRLGQEQACEALEIFDELMETEVAIVLPHIKSIIEFCLEIAANEKLGNAPRVRALSHLSWVISLKKKTIKKHKLVGFTLAAFALAAEFQSVSLPKNNGEWGIIYDAWGI